MSFAVSNVGEIHLVDEELIPLPPNSLHISDEIDERAEFFGHVILNISWPALQSMIIINCNTIIIMYS